MILRKYFYRKRLEKMISDITDQCLFADEGFRRYGQIKPVVIYKQYWRLVKLLNKHKNK